MAPAPSNTHSPLTPPIFVVLHCIACSYGTGYRFKLRHTRAIVDAIHSGELAGAEYETLPLFGLQVGRGMEEKVWTQSPGFRGGSSYQGHEPEAREGRRRRDGQLFLAL